MNWNWPTPTDSWRRGFRKRMYDKFQEYRFGARLPRNNTIPPIYGFTPEVVIPGMEQYAFPYIQKDKIGVDIDAITNSDFLPEGHARVLKHIGVLKEYFVAHYPKMQYKKCLGWGGNGLAAAFDDIDELGRKKRSVVVKMLFSSDEKYMKAEVNALRVHRKAEHIVQLLYADGEGVPSGNDKNVSLTAISGKSEDSAVHSDGLGDDDDEFPEPEEEPEVRKEVPTANVFITEMLENGDLSCFISAVRHHGEKVPNAFLWRFLQCFTRMCIGLAWPPMSVDEFKDMPAPIRETVPARLKDTPLRICHFDFDPKNIFIGDVIGNGEHEISPILKLGDFGMTTHIQEGRPDWYYERFRQFSKFFFFAPEQFCIDWDYIEPGNGIVSRHPLAGNYGAHTNIWAVGYLMECLITHCYPAHPPKPTISNRKPPVGKDEYWTYAAHLDQEVYNHVDRDLLDVIHRLQAHLPTDRPDLQELEAYVDFNLRTKDNDGLTDEQLAQWLQKMLYEPPPESSDRWKPHPVIRSAEKPVEQPEEQPVGKPVEIIGTGPVHPVPNNRFHRQGARGRIEKPPRGLRSRYRKDGRWVYGLPKQRNR